MCASQEWISEDVIRHVATRGNVLSNGLRMFDPIEVKIRVVVANILDQSWCCFTVSNQIKVLLLALGVVRAHCCRFYDLFVVCGIEVDLLVKACCCRSVSCRLGS